MLQYGTLNGSPPPRAIRPFGVIVTLVAHLPPCNVADGIRPIPKLLDFALVRRSVGLRKDSVTRLGLSIANTVLVERQINLAADRRL